MNNLRWYSRAIAPSLCMWFALPTDLANAQMSTAGAFQMTKSGAGMYQVPIKVPPGVAGMEPKLSLVYNSQAGSGLLGTGWSLSGLSVIARCPRTVPQDGRRERVTYSAADAFCLDGQRLVANGPTEYRTELETHTKITANGGAGSGPAWFEARTKSGQILEFGNTPDSRIEGQGRPDVRIYALNKVKDIQGNYITISYSEDNASGAYRPTRIDYTANDAAGLKPTQWVQFTYADRDDVTPLYVEGSVVKDTKRLTNIKTYVATRPDAVTDYQVAYDDLGAGGRSRVSSIAECDRTGICLPATTMDYSTPAGLNWGAPSNLTDLGSNVLTDGSTYPVFTGDWNGDGRTDFARVTSGGIKFFVSNGASFEQLFFLSGLSPSEGYANGSSYPIITGDWNGDGRTDFARMRNGGIQFFVSTGSSFVPFIDLPGIGRGDGSYDNPGMPLIVGDWNGDGRTDFARAFYNGIQFFVSTGTGFEPHSFYTPWSNDWQPLIVGDWNGDGRTDFALTAGGSMLFLVSNGTGFVGFSEGGSVLADGYGEGTRQYPDANRNPVITGDWNGDGRTDYARVGDASIRFFVSTGGCSPGYPACNAGAVQGGFVKLYELSGWSGFQFPDGNQYPIITGDWNGDGRTDFARVHADGIQFFASTGVSFVPLHNEPGWGPNAGLTNNSTFPIFTGDWNGDGKTDFGRVTATAASFLTELNAVPDQMTKITSGLGTQTTLVQKPLTDPSVYARSSDGAYPIVDFQGPLYVVSSATTSDGIGGTNRLTYEYSGAKIELNGRGFLGFNKIKATDPQGLKTITTFNQQWPFVGLPALVRKTTADDRVLNQVASTYLCIDPVNNAPCPAAAPGNRYFPYLSQSIETRSDLNGAPLPTVTTTNTNIDAVYGNIRTTTVSASDGYAKVTSNDYENNAAAWLIGRVKRSSLTSTAPDVAPAPQLGSDPGGDPLGTVPAGINISVLMAIIQTLLLD